MINTCVSAKEMWRCVWHILVKWVGRVTRGLFHCWFKWCYKEVPTRRIMRRFLYSPIRQSFEDGVAHTIFHDDDSHDSGIVFSVLVRLRVLVRHVVLQSTLSDICSFVVPLDRAGIHVRARCCSELQAATGYSSGRPPWHKLCARSLACTAILNDRS